MLDSLLCITEIPAVASALRSVSDAELSIPVDKVNENTAGSQTSVAADLAPQEVKPSLEEMVVVGYGGDSKDNGSGTPSKTVKVYEVVEKAPMFPGGEAELLKFIATNIRYPEQAMKDSIQGRVIVQFVVDKDGKVRDPKIIRSQGELLDNEAKRIVLEIPDFIPGELNGKPVAVYYTLPVSFRLQGGKSTKRNMRNIKIGPEHRHDPAPTYFVDGKRVESLGDIKPEDVESISINKNDSVNYPGGRVDVTLKKK